jgi:hypothetical protein
MIVIPMAGLSQRFQDAGITTPKYMLDLHGRSVFARAVGSFEDYFGAEPFLFIAREQGDTAAFVSREAESLGIASFQTVVLPAPTRGQADTVAQGLSRARVSGAAPLTIFNIDTIRPNFSYPEAAWMAGADGYLEVMRGDDPGFSYVRSDPAADDQRVVATVEKVVISDLASTGLYYFRRADLFLDALAAHEGNSATSEIYIAPLYNALIRRGVRVHYHRIDESDVLFCGTPAQYRRLQGAPELFMRRRSAPPRPA